MNVTMITSILRSNKITYKHFAVVVYHNMNHVVIRLDDWTEYDIDILKDGTINITKLTEGKQS